MFDSVMRLVMFVLCVVVPPLYLQRAWRRDPNPKHILRRAQWLTLWLFLLGGSSAMCVGFVHVIRFSVTPWAELAAVAVTYGCYTVIGAMLAAGVWLPLLGLWSIIRPARFLRSPQSPRRDSLADDDRGD